MHDGDQSEPFNINWCETGCVIATTLFSIFLAAFLSQAKRDLTEGADITHRADSGVFKLSRLTAKSKVKIVTIVDLKYADDCAVVAHSAQYIQNTLDALVDAYKPLPQRKIFYINRHNHQLQHHHLTLHHSIEGTALDKVDHFAYL